MLADKVTMQILELKMSALAVKFWPFVNHEKCRKRPNGCDLTPKKLQVISLFTDTEF